VARLWRSLCAPSDDWRASFQAVDNRLLLHTAADVPALLRALQAAEEEVVPPPAGAQVFFVEKCDSLYACMRPPWHAQFRTRPLWLPN